MHKTDKKCGKKIRSAERLYDLFMSDHCVLFRPDMLADRVYIVTEPDLGFIDAILAIQRGSLYEEKR